MRKIFTLFIFILSFNTYADVTCSGEVSAVYAGIHGLGNNEHTLFVYIANVGVMPLGRYDSDLAKLRFSMAQTGFVTQKKITLKYYSYDSCKEALADLAAPTYAGLS